MWTFESLNEGEGKSVEDTSVWDWVYWWSKAELRKMSSLLFKPLLIFLMKCPVSFHLLPLGRPFRKENSWISQVQSSSRCFLAAWGSLGFSGSCSGCGCERTCRKLWSWSPGPPLAWEKVGTEKRTHYFHILCHTFHSFSPSLTSSLRYLFSCGTNPPILNSNSWQH